MGYNKHINRAISLAYIALALLALWLFAKFALGWLLPFLTAFLLAKAIEKPVRLLTTRLRFPRALASGLCAALVFAAVVLLVSLAVGRAVFELSALARQLPALFQSLRELIASAPPDLAGYINAALGSLTSVSAKLLSLLGSLAQNSPRFFLFVFATAVGTFFISSGYTELSAFLLRQIPERHHKALRDFKSDIKTTVGKWARCQLLLTGITFLELFVLFLILRIDFAILLALAVAFIDMLPVLGVGTVLVPWGVVSLLGGNTPRGLTLLVAFGVILLVRNITEPKLIGAQLGLPPIAALLAMYVGFCAAGVFGMVLFPVGLILIKHLNDRGFIRIWQ
ncbi:MAG: sporulation integral membrane protein YtvI [Oscillospiraceae bacterium]|jgi:sporulation integral membrane protein YtvI|nr:sporulation integral membrane protein YtvI [Oscillospiraceae bacterium]